VSGAILVGVRDEVSRDREECRRVGDREEKREGMVRGGVRRKMVAVFCAITTWTE